MGIAIAFLLVQHSSHLWWWNSLGYWLLVLTIAHYFFSEESFEVSQMLRMKARTQYMAWVGLVPVTVPGLESGRNSSSRGPLHYLSPDNVSGFSGRDSATNR